jgi:hypothetical protein
MGHHRIEIDMVGGHGCDRDAKEGQPLKACGSPSCPDCAARRFVADFKARGAFGLSPSGATITHWPGTSGEVVDDLLTDTRAKGSFSR